MRRLKDYLSAAAWQFGLAYIALWAVTFVVMDYGPRLFGQDCRPDSARLMFYWICDPSSPLRFAADVANTALTATVWAPVYIAAATVRPEAIGLAIPILLVHLIGLPTTLPVGIRLLERMLAAPRWLRSRPAGDGQDDAPRLRVLPPPVPGLPKVKPRETFGLRGQRS